MIPRPDDMPRDRHADGSETLRLSDGGGLTQFGAYRERLAPGARSSDRHWHSAEDEFLYMLEGRGTVVDDDGDHELGPGDAACWRHGDPNGHHLVNRSEAPLAFLIVGSRVAGDICHYPDSGRRQVNHDRTWEILAADGTRVKGGDLPPALLGLPPVWGTPFDPARPASRILRAGMVAAVSVPSSYPAPYTLPAERLRFWPLSDAGGISQFGAFVEELAPGAQSSQRHWHEAEDEFLYLLDGALTVVESHGSVRLSAGQVACWPAGAANAHCLINPGDRPARYLIVGTRSAADACHYPDIDLHFVQKDGTKAYTHKDGTPYPGWPKRSET